MKTKFRIEKGTFEMDARPINYTVDDLRQWLNQQTDQDHEESLGTFDTIEEARAAFELKKNRCRTKRVATRYGFSVIDFDEIQIVEFEVDEDGEDSFDLYEIYESFIADDDSLSNYEEYEEQDNDD